tara:strand:- start:1428 stop:1667 length:240 start_codon:yes stop_codon:yes gene_type:complete
MENKYSKYSYFANFEDLLDQIVRLIEAKAIFNLNSEMLFCQTYHIPQLTDKQHEVLMWWTTIISERQFEILDICKKRDE